jgi:hypothetical protein
MTRFHIEVHASSPASVEQVWALLGDVTTWKDWATFTGSELERPGDDEPNGVNAIRRFNRGPKKITRERVVAFDAPRHYGYVLLEGVPVDDYRSDVTLTPSSTGRGTEITWKSSYQANPVSGFLVKLVLGRFIAHTAKALAKAAANVAPVH